MKAEISMPSVVRGVTIEVQLTGRRRMAARRWLGCKVMVLAARIIGCSIAIDVKADK